MTMTMQAMRVVADICLYGTNRTGAGWILAVNPVAVAIPAWSNGQIGTGEPHAGLTFTEAIHQAVENLTGEGVTMGLVRVFHPGGETMSTFDLGQPVPSYGKLLASGVTEAPVYVFSEKELIAAAGNQ